MGRSACAGLLALALVLALPAPVRARCAPGLVRLPPPAKAIPAAYAAAAKGSVSIEWFGHAYFRLISPGGIRVVTDPFSRHRGYPIPRTNPHVVTIGKETPNHHGIDIVGGSPLVLRGLREGGLEWGEVRRQVGDVWIFSIPIAQGGYGDDDYGSIFGKGATFVFEMGGLCIAHLGDLAEPMNPSQLRRLGKVHLAFVVLSERVSMGPEGAAEMVRRIGPRIAVPMHYYDDEETLERFIRSARALGALHRVRRLKERRLLLHRKRLPPPTEILLMRHD